MAAHRPRASVPPSDRRPPSSGRRRSDVARVASAVADPAAEVEEDLAVEVPEEVPAEVASEDHPGAASEVGEAATAALLLLLPVADTAVDMAVDEE
eukprot:CAMPEP_0178625898 /NCGR_PEP_ID=MMETSP0698-20121128/8121_1 /TAXON_ID=265572 /ORGANISM="Extubocellulus spinifer, Strain CCMP396" /LENGTH=95 /DNA_ID=CAMNT_0020265087 /DNA_START=784 /DNA_END=1068 /DNA_ORIENTATION=+